MPFIHLTFGQTVSAEKQQQIARRSTELIAQLLGKRAEVTAVRIECTDNYWTVAGQPVAAGLIACHGEIFITAGTNTEVEKAAMIAALHALLAETCGQLPEASYLVIHEVSGTDWGYSGQTQRARQSRTSRL